MSERKESSVLFSLRELQTIEEERVTEEASAATRAQQAIREAKEAEERAIRDAEEARRMAAENAERQAREDVERRQREEQLRLEESERRARIEAQGVLEQQRLAKEMEIREMEVRRKKPAWIIAVVVSVFLIGGLAVFFKNQADDRAKARKAEIALNLALEKQQQDIKLAQIDIDKANADMDEAFKKLEAAISEDEKAAAVAARKQAQADLKAGREKLQALKELNIKKEANAAKKKAKQEKDKINKCINSSDPLCGL